MMWPIFGLFYHRIRQYAHPSLNDFWPIEWHEADI